MYDSGPGIKPSTQGWEADVPLPFSLKSVVHLSYKMYFY